MTVGKTLANRYRLDAELGRGGMGVVYRSHDMLLDRDVAIKISSDPRLGADGRARLLREMTEAFTTARVEGTAMPMEQTVAYVLKQD